MFSSKDIFFGSQATGGFTVSKSLRFRSSASAYLSKATFATPTDNKKWTWSAWVKIGTINPWAGLFYGGGIGTSQPLTELYLYSDGTLYYQTYNGSVNTGLLQTTQVFRDPSAWYHIVLVIDIANATANNRQRIYVNGAEVTAFSTRTNHGTSDATYFNNASYAGYIGESFPVSGTAAKYFDGYMAEVNFIDGQALTPSSFGAYDTNGVWQPAAYTGSYGNNGFYLPFINNSSAPNLGYDYAPGSYSLNLRAAGSNIGNMTDSGGLAGAFDGVVNNATGSANKINGTDNAVTPKIGGYVGKDWGSGNTKTITAFIFRSPTNEWVNNQTTGTTITITLQGSSDNSTWTDLGSGTFTDVNTGTSLVKTTGLTATAYRYHRIKIESSGTFNGGGCRCGELELYESGSYGLNSWQVNNISVTSGTTYDSMLDSPTNAVGDIGNYAVWSPIDNNSATISDGNLKAVLGNSGAYVARATIAQTTGKWYAEVSPTSMTTNDGIIGVVRSDSALSTIVYSQPNGWWYYANTGNKFNNAVSTAYGNPYTTTDVIGIAVDLDNGAIYFGKQTGGTGSMVWQGGGDPTSGASRTGAAFTAGSSNLSLGLSLTVGVGQATSAGPETYVLNCGQRPFSATAPSGYSALNTQNLPTPTITNGAQYMAAITWSGDNTSPRSITPSSTNSGNNPLPTTFQPDMVWIKARNQAYDGLIFDSVRLAGKSIVSSSTAAEITNNGNGYLSAFNTDGFAVVQGSSSILSVNASGVTYVGWEWKGGGTSVVNNVGTIQSNVSANTSAGFSVVTGVSTSTTGSASVGHGLGVTPSMVIFKNRDIVDAWYVWHTSLGSSTAGNYIILNTTAAATSSANIWGGTGYGMTSTTLGLNQSAFFSASNQKFVFYAFAAVSGYSAFGSYTGNGSADGPFVYTGFRPRWIMIKPNVAGENWVLIDTSRDTYNVNGYELYANSSAAEASANRLDILSNGFKLRAAGALNSSSNTMIYAAFAENPFKISRAR